MGYIIDSRKVVAKRQGMPRSRFDITKNEFLNGERLRFLCFVASSEKTNDKSNWSAQLAKCDEGDSFQKWEFPYMDKEDGVRKDKISWRHQSNELAIHFQVERQMKEFSERLRTSISQYVK